MIQVTWMVRVLDYAANPKRAHGDAVKAACAFWWIRKALEERFGKANEQA